MCELDRGWNFKWGEWKSGFQLSWGGGLTEWQRGTCWAGMNGRGMLIGLMFQQGMISLPLKKARSGIRADRGSGFGSPPPMKCATTSSPLMCPHRVVHGDGGSEVPWPLGQISSYFFKPIRKHLVLTPRRLHQHSDKIAQRHYNIQPSQRENNKDAHKCSAASDVLTNCRAFPRLWVEIPAVNILTRYMVLLQYSLQ